MSTKGVRYRTDPVVPTAPLRTLVPPVAVYENEGSRGCDFPYSRLAFVRDLAKRTSVTERHAQRYLSAILSKGTVPLWLADEVCTMMGVPFGFLYMEESA